METKPLPRPIASILQPRPLQQSSLVVAVTLTPAIAGDYSCLKVRLHFTRDKWFYYTTVFMPGGCGWGACPPV